MGMANFDNYDLGPVAGQVWEGGTGPGTGMWSKWASTSSSGVPPDPDIVEDPTGDGRGRLLHVHTIYNDSINPVAATFTPPADLYPDNHVITLEWDQWRNNVDSEAFVLEGLPYNHGPSHGSNSAFNAWSFDLMYSDPPVAASFMPTGSIPEAAETAMIPLTAEVWTHMRVTYDFDTMMVTASSTIGGVEQTLPGWWDGGPMSFLMYNAEDIIESVLRRCSIIRFGQCVGTQYEDHLYIDNFALTGVGDTPTPAEPPVEPVAAPLPQFVMGHEPQRHLVVLSVR